MNYRFVLDDTLGYVLWAAGIGLVAGGAVSLIKEKGRVNNLSKFRVSLPDRITNFPDMANCIVTLASDKRSNMTALGKVIRRCETLLDLHASLEAANPSTVKHTISGAATQMHNSISKYLYIFYLESDIRTRHGSQAKSEGDSESFIPYNPDLRDAHVTLLQLVDAIAFEIRMMVKEKMEAKAALTPYRESL